MPKLSHAASVFLERVNRLLRVFVPRLERFHLELIGAKAVGYMLAPRGGYWIYSLEIPHGEVDGQNEDRKN